MSSGNRIPLEKALTLAASLASQLSPGCQRIEIAGSVRRLCPTVGDLEIVCVEKRKEDLFGDDAGSALHPILQGLVEDGFLDFLKGGDRYKQYLLPREGIKVDLFISNKERWGVLFLIRTGPAKFSHRFVTSKSQGGLLPSHLRIQDGRVWNGDKVLDTPEEATVFQVCGLPWIEPKDRK